MKVVHLSSYDLYGGAAKAAFRLHTALVEAGIDSTMLVRRKDSARPDVRQPGGLGMKLWLRAQRRCDRLPLVFKGVEAKMFSPGWVPDGLVRQLHAMRPDIVHLHWVADGFSGLIPCGGLTFQWFGLCTTCGPLRADAIMLVIAEILSADAVIVRYLVTAGRRTCHAVGGCDVS